MTELRLRGWHQNNVGSLLMSITLDSAATGPHVQRGKWADTAQRLVQRFTAHSLPGTWGLSDPAQSAATASILSEMRSSGVAHEVAVLGDDAWIGTRAGRPRFAKELARRVEQARAKGIAINSLLYRGDGPGDHLDLLVKHRISAVCSIDAAQYNRHHYVLPKALRYSLWDLRATGIIPTPGTWFAAQRLMRKIRRAADEGAMFHLLIDAPALEQQGQREEEAIARLIQQAALLRDRGLLNVETLASATSRLSEVPPAAPQRSILRLAG